MKPLVSILIPAFNVERWIGATLSSALGQTWRPIEVIVVDDGSRDGTAAAALAFEDRGVRVIRQPQGGAAAARNQAFRASRGEYIQYLDADDLLAPDKIERQLAVALAQGGARTLLSSAWGRFFYRTSRARFRPTALWADLSPAECMLRKMEQNVFMQTGAWLMPRALAEAAGQWNTRLLTDDDGEYFARVLAQSRNVLFVPEARMYYRTRSPASSLSYAGRSGARLESQLTAMELQIAHLRAMDDSPRARAACVTYLQDALSLFHARRPDLEARAIAQASALGGRLEPPRLAWKYRWLEPFVGRRAAWHAQIVLPRMRWGLVRGWDRIGAALEAPRRTRVEAAPRSACVDR
jgi:GT2 family glycosyltransferase